MSVPSLEALKIAAADEFTRLDFQNVCWAGIFESFIRVTANESSDFDVVVIEAPYNWSNTKQLLEDVLPVKWSRPVDVIHIGEGQDELRGYIQLELLLASRTIFIRDDASRDEVARLRAFAKESLEKGHSLYSGVASRIDEVRHLVNDVPLQVGRSPLSSLFKTSNILMLERPPPATSYELVGSLILELSSRIFFHGQKQNTQIFSPRRPRSSLICTYTRNTTQLMKLSGTLLSRIRRIFARA